MKVKVNNLENPTGIEVTTRAGARGAVAIAGVQEAGEQVVAVAPGVLQAPIVQARAMGDTLLLATYDDLTGIEIGVELQKILCFYCWDIRFYLNEAYVKRTVNGGKPSLVGQNGGPTFIIRIREVEDGENGDRAPGRLPTRLGKRLDKELEENYIDKHLVHENNLCLANEEQCNEIIAVT